MIDEIACIAQRLNIETTIALDDDGAPLPIESDEKIVSVSKDVTWVFGESDSVGCGMLYITTRRVVWCSSNQLTCFALRYTQIVMHAISRDAEAQQKPCIYIQLDEGSEDMNMQEDNDDEGSSQDISPEIRFVIDDSTKIDEVFKFLCDCAALNPDSEMEEDAGDFIFNEDEVYNNVDQETRAALLASRADEALDVNDEEELDELIGGDPGRFDDEEEEEGKNQLP